MQSRKLSPRDSGDRMMKIEEFVNNDIILKKKKNRLLCKNLEICTSAVHIFISSINFYSVYSQYFNTYEFKSESF